jgi:C4-dicarboxylate-specific signal transduction histidine kinase
VGNSSRTADWFASRTHLLAAGGVLIGAIALIDWKVEPNISLGLLYLIPILLLAGSLGRVEITLIAALCVVLREAFAPFAWQPPVAPRLLMCLIAFVGSGLFVAELARNRRLAVQHLRQVQEMEEQTRALIETSPAAILIVEGDGTIRLANQAAHRLLRTDGGALAGDPISRYLPLFEGLPPAGANESTARTRVECRGRRGGDDLFLAHVWFSTYRTSSGPRLAAIVEDASEDLRDREELSHSSVEAAFSVLASAVSHEVRNLSAAAAAVYARLGRIPGLADNQDYAALGSLVQALEKIALAKLPALPDGAPAGVDLGAVLEDLRILLEPMLRDSEITHRWDVSGPLPRVHGDHHALLQVFLNLSKNTLRVLGGQQRREVSISVAHCKDQVVVRWRDSGPGVRRPESLFQPFQPGAEGSGLGLYVSRVLMQSLDGDLRYEPSPAGSCFVLELRPVAGKEAREAHAGGSARRKPPVFAAALPIRKDA